MPQVPKSPEQNRGAVGQFLNRYVGTGNALIHRTGILAA